MYIDSHVHYDMKAFNKDRETVLADIRQSGIDKVVNAAITFESNYEMREKLGMYDWIYYSVGIHPNRVGTDDSVDERWETGLLSLTVDKDKTVAVGETGLDFYRLNRNERGEFDEESVLKLARQYKWFRKQIKLAICMDLPLILHVRNAHTEAIDILKEYAEDFPEVNAGVVHCFNGTLDEAIEYIRMGFSIGIGGLICDEENSTLRDAVVGIPINKILLETDCPYVVPKGINEKRNSSLNLPMIAEAVAKIKGMDIAEVVNSTTNNTRVLFDL